jgi:hypothetical protein
MLINIFPVRFPKLINIFLSNLMTKTKIRSINGQIYVFRMHWISPHPLLNDVPPLNSKCSAIYVLKIIAKVFTIHQSFSTFNHFLIGCWSEGFNALSSWRSSTVTNWEAYIFLGYSYSPFLLYAFITHNFFASNNNTKLR